MNMDKFLLQPLGSVLALVFGLIFLTSILYMAGFINATGISLEILPISFADIIGAVIKFTPDIVGDFMPVIMGYFFFEVIFARRQEKKLHFNFRKEFWFFTLSFFIVGIGFVAYYFTASRSLLLMFLYYALFGLIVFLWVYVSRNKNLADKFGSIIIHVLFLITFSVIYYIQGFTEGLDANFYEKNPISIYTNKTWQPAYFIYQLNRGLILRIDNKVEFINYKLIEKIRYN